MSRTTLLYIILIVLLLAVLPVWPYAAPWGLGWYPSGIIVFILLIFLLIRL